MNKKKLISLPTAKKLFETAKKFDFELPESEYVWTDLLLGRGWHTCVHDYVNWNHGKYEKCIRIPAYDDYELGEMLPAKINIPFKNGKPRKYDNPIRFWKNSNDFWVTFYVKPQGVSEYVWMKGVTEPESRAAMLIYLIENKLI